MLKWATGKLWVWGEAETIKITPNNPGKSGENGFTVMFVVYFQNSTNNDSGFFCPKDIENL